MYLLTYLHPKTGNIEYVGCTSDEAIANKWKDGNDSSVIYDYEELNPVYTEEKIHELRYKD